MPLLTGYDSISVLSKHGGLAPLRIGLWKDQTPGKANLGYRCALSSWHLLSCPFFARKAHPHYLEGPG